MTQGDQPNYLETRKVRKLSPYFIPIVICVLGIILFFTIALAPIGLIVFAVGLIWAGIAVAVAHSHQHRREPPETEADETEAGDSPV